MGKEAIVSILFGFLVLSLFGIYQEAFAETFPGDNGKIAFTSHRDGNQEIYVMNADGTGQTNISNNAFNDFFPSWSPDGTKIVFTSHRDGYNEIYVMNADGTGQTNISNTFANDHYPLWSPDGTKITFTSHRDGQSEIYVMNADGTGQTNISNNVSDDVTPSWSPDGTKIAFASIRDGDREIYVMNADGTGQTNISNNVSDDVTPSWSPDGTKIVFTSNRDGNDEIYVMNADGTGQTNISNNAATDFYTSWSPDGTKIAFASIRDGDWEIYVMNADGTGQTNISNNAAVDNTPSWGVNFKNFDDPVLLDSPGEVGRHPSITIGTDGFPIISYWDTTNMQIKVVHCNDHSCTTFTSRPIASDSGAFTNIKIGSDGFPIISYSDISTGFLKVIHCRDIPCLFIDPIIELDKGRYNSLAIGIDDLPIISYYDAVTNDLNVIHCTEVNCSSQDDAISLDTFGDIGADPSITIGSDGFPIISYGDLTTGILKVVHCTSIDCSTFDPPITIDAPDAVGRSNPSLAIGQDDFPIISYQDLKNKDHKLVHCTSIDCSTFDPPIILDSFGNVGSDSSLAIGTDDLPLIISLDNTYGDLMALHCNNVECSSYDPPVPIHTEGFVGRYGSVTMGFDGFPIVSYLHHDTVDLYLIHCKVHGCSQPTGADTDLTASMSNTSPKAGSIITYTISISNHGKNSDNKIRVISDFRDGGNLDTLQYMGFRSSDPAVLDYCESNRPFPMGDSGFVVNCNPSIFPNPDELQNGFSVENNLVFYPISLDPGETTTIEVDFLVKNESFASLSNKIFVQNWQSNEIHVNDNFVKIDLQSIGTDFDNDGYATDGSGLGFDCNDNDATIFPTAKEIPNDGVDQNCDGQDLIGIDNFNQILSDIQNLVDPWSNDIPSINTLVFELENTLDALSSIEQITASDSLSNMMENIQTFVDEGGIPFEIGQELIESLQVIFNEIRDDDGDGIYNEVDLNPNIISNQFIDPDGTTSGIITPGDGPFTISNKPGNGVIIDIGIGTLPTNVQGTGICTPATILNVDVSGSNFELECASTTIEVLTGEVSAVATDNNLTVEVVLESDQGISFDFNELGLPTVENLSDQPISIDVNGNLITIIDGEILVVNQSPISDANGPYLSSVNIPESLNSTGSFDPDGDALTTLWSTIATQCSIANSEPSITCTESGIFDVSLTVTDPFGESNTDNTSIVIYDPDGGFVTGGGWIMSPAGSYTADPTLEGKATFGFVSKYKKGATTPTGETEFQFKVADLNFHSEIYDWLVVAGAKAMYKGEGTINGVGNYGFMLSAIDAQVNGDQTDKDKFRIKIWDENETVVYDNQVSDLEDADPTTEISGGSIVVHSGKGKPQN